MERQSPGTKTMITTEKDRERQRDRDGCSSGLGGILMEMLEVMH